MEHYRLENLSAERALIGDTPDKYEIDYRINFWFDGSMFALLLAIAPLKLEISTIEKAIEEKATADLYFRLAQDWKNSQPS